MGAKCKSQFKQGIRTGINRRVVKRLPSLSFTHTRSLKHNRLVTIYFMTPKKDQPMIKPQGSQNILKGPSSQSAKQLGKKNKITLQISLDSCKEHKSCGESRNWALDGQRVHRTPAAPAVRGSTCPKLL